ncbi:MAG: type II toxin-antitoxin system VapC family toxin [Leptospiraceae bacterium]|nr:type II toxin-antitoxin system VapC family toxin [Leptospiraceae bacterium]
MKEQILIETSVISYYTAPFSRDLVVAGHQEVTIEWWEKKKDLFECFISTFIFQEISRGNTRESEKRLKVVEELKILEEKEEIKRISEMYFLKMSIPERSKLDLFHLATATFYEMDYILSWNMKHIVNPTTKRIYEKINRENNWKSPNICTPEELLMEGPDELE